MDKEKSKRFIELAFLRIANSYWFKTEDIMWAFTIGINQWHPVTSKAVKLQNFYTGLFTSYFSYSLYMLDKVYTTEKIDFTTFILLIFLYFNAMMFVLEGNSRYVFPLHPIYTIGVSFVIYNVLKKLLLNVFQQFCLKFGLLH